MSDDPSLDLLARYLKDELGADERRRVEAWLAADLTRATELEDLRQILAAAGPSHEWDLDRVWGSIDAGMRAMPAATRPAPRLDLAPAAARRWPAALRAAAAVLVLASGAAAALVLSRRSDTEKGSATPTVIATARAERLSVRLPDSTLVMLAPETRLEVVPGFGKLERRIRLEGAAVFTVTHDAARPFAVETRRAVTRDLGTRFLVRSYPTDSVTDVVVAEGLVAVRQARGTDSLVVRRGELGRVEPDGRLAVTRGVGLDRYFGWTEGRLVFDNTPLSEVAEQVGRWYGVEVQVSGADVGRRRVTASFRDESVDDVLRLVGALIGAEVVRGDRGFILRAKS
jgi:transmembrane sensor